MATIYQKTIPQKLTKINSNPPQGSAARGSSSDHKRGSRYDPDGEPPRSFLTDDVDIEDLGLYYAAIRDVANEEGGDHSAYTWSISGKKRNKMVHALNGNTHTLSRGQAAALTAMLTGVRVHEASKTKAGKKAMAKIAGFGGASKAVQGAYNRATKAGKKRHPQGDRVVQTRVKPTRRDNRVVVERTASSGSNVVVRDMIATKLGDAVTSADGTIKMQAYTINPAESAMEWVYEEARSKRFYRLDSGVVVYNTIEADSERGEIVGGIQYNLLAPPPKNLDDIMKLPTAKRSQIASNFQLRIDPKLFHSEKQWLRTTDKYQPDVSSYHGCIIWVATENFKSGVADNYKVGNWTFQARWRFKQDSTPGVSGTAAPGDEIRMRNGYTLSCDPGVARVLSGWAEDYNEIEGFVQHTDTLANDSVVAAFDCYAWINASIPVASEDISVNWVYRPTVRLNINGITVMEAFETMTTTAAFAGYAISNITVWWYGLLKAGDVISLAGYNSSLSNGTVVFSGGAASYFSIRLRGVSVGSEAVYEPLMAPGPPSSVSAAPPAKEEDKCQGTTVKSVSTEEADAAYREKVILLNKLQTELDELDSVATPLLSTSLN